MKQKNAGVAILALLLTAGAITIDHTISAQHMNGSSHKSASTAGKTALKDGDVIFQVSRSAQSKAIQLATHSAYSHCGIVYKEGGKYWVYEAVEPVKLTPLNDWIARGRNGKYVAKRLRNAGTLLTPQRINSMKQAGKQFMGKHYDLYFEWGNDRICCSELVWKIYKECTGLSVGKLEKLKDFDLASAPVRKKLAERYGDKIPMNEVVISPASIYNSELLETVAAN